MYKSYTATEYKKYIGLPSDYKVDGMLIYGTWNKNKQLQILKQVILLYRLLATVTKVLLGCINQKF